MENVSTNCKDCFVQTVLHIVNIVLQNVLIKYVKREELCNYDCLSRHM